jgi:hypothetical protein
MLGSERMATAARPGLGRRRPRAALWASAAHGPAAAPSAVTLERELGALLTAARLGPRQARAVAARLGWDGAGGATLADAGEREGYTRERVRQLEQRVVAYARRVSPRVPLVERALAVIASAAPARRSAVGLALRDAGLARRPFDPAGVLNAARLLGFDPPFAVDDALVLFEGRGDESVTALTAARRLSRSFGPVCAADVASELGAPARDVERLLRLRDELVELEATGWFVPRRAPRSRNELRLRKVLAIAHELSVDELVAALCRGPRAVPLPGPVVVAYCDLLPWTAVDRAAGLVRSRRPLDPARELSDAELCTYEILLAHGPLDIGTAAGLAAARGFNEATVGFVLRYSPITRPAGGGRVALVSEGAAVAEAA